MATTHTKVLTGPDGTTPDRAQPSDWNADHTIDLSDYAGPDLPDGAIPASHSGSTHAAAQAAAEATAAAANTADIATHAAIAAAHHAKYTDAEALAALAGETIAAAAVNFGDEDLDTYDEGEWTPELRFASYATDDLSVAYATQSGVYTRVGRKVTCDLVLITSTFTHTSASGDFRVTGLPFAASGVATPGFAGDVAAEGWSISNIASLSLAPQHSQAWLLMYGSRSAVTRLKFGSGQWPTGGTVKLAATFTYYV